jgi:hypothetical protein
MDSLFPLFGDYAPKLQPYVEGIYLLFAGVDRV